MTDTLLSDPSPSAPESVRILPWPDPVVDAVGVDARSPYVEQFWLGLLGPSTSFLLRRLADGLDRAPEGFDLPLAETARALGLAPDGGGRHAAFLRAFDRLVLFGLARRQAGALQVRRRLPPLTRRQLDRLDAPLRKEHDRWLAIELAPDPALRARAIALAASLIGAGDGPARAETTLQQLGLPPRTSTAAVRAAIAHHAHDAA